MLLKFFREPEYSWKEMELKEDLKEMGIFACLKKEDANYLTYLRLQTI